MSTKKIRIKIHERVLRDRKGLLKCCYVTALSPAQKISEDESLEKIAQRMNMSEPKVAFVLDEAMQYAVRQLVQGYIVEIPQFGTLRLSIKTKAKARRIDAGVKAIEGVSVNFLPCPKMRKMIELDNLQFKIEES